VISQAGQPAGQPNLKKPTALRGAVGVWDWAEINQGGESFFAAISIVPDRIVYLRNSIEIKIIN